MTILEAVEVLKNPKAHWSREKDEATQVAINWFLEIFGGEDEAFESILNSYNGDADHDTISKMLGRISDR